MQVDLNGTLLRAEARDADVLAAIDQVADKLEEQIRRLKSKIKHHKGRPDAPTVAAVITPSADPFSLFALALPMCIFYEISILFGRIRERRQRKALADVPS